jgi:glycosyltransferase involved in cell wall biosynthesis
MTSSILKQTYPGFEWIVIDGGSSDGTLDVIRQHEKDISRWISERDRGIYDAMNKGVSTAGGEWIVFMNAGDVFYDDNVLADVASTLEKSEKEVIVYGDAEIVNGADRHIQQQRDRHLDLTKSIIHQSMFIRRQFLLGQPYDLQYRIMADYDNLLSVSVKNPGQCKYIDRIICRYDKTGVSSKPLYTYFKEYYAVARKRMGAIGFLWFNLYILPRLIWSFRLKLK